MRAILQRVERAEVYVPAGLAGQIAQGWLVLLGVAPGDGDRQVQWLAEKIAHLRAFEDAEGKMNLSVLDVGGSVLSVSNFTLYADCTKGRRPSFVGAAGPAVAEPLYRAFGSALRALGVPVAEGVFGADMRVQLVNAGPVTLILEAPA